VFWGEVVVSSFLLVFIPFTVTALVTKNLYFLVAAEVSERAHASKTVKKNLYFLVSAEVSL
jgi:hypothetical protein